MDVMTLDGKSVLHAVDETTHFNEAIFLRNHTAETCKTLLRCLSRVYLGSLDYLWVEKGTKFVAKTLVERAEADLITVLKSPIEFPNSMSHVERYHFPPRSVYENSLFASQIRYLQFPLSNVLHIFY